MGYECFGLVLMVTHACNLRCSYCYNGTKSHRAMDRRVAFAALGRAIRSVSRGGTLELGFFGGEPLLEAELIEETLAHAARLAADTQVAVRPGLTTNGTVQTESAWRLLAREDLAVTVSFDGLPEMHDRHRRHADGRGSWAEVWATIERLAGMGRAVRVAMVLRPDTVAFMPEGLAWLFDRGVRQVDLALDLWTAWTRDDARRLKLAIGQAADVWHARLPECSVNWFDEKAALLAGLAMNRTARCGFGNGEIAVAPSGNLYPCERLIGEDRPDAPLRLPGSALEGFDFCRAPLPPQAVATCTGCAIQFQCGTFCRCSNYVRTGDVNRPDGLLCLLDRACCRETARILRRMGGASSSTSIPQSSEEELDHV